MGWERAARARSCSTVGPAKDACATATSAAAVSTCGAATVCGGGESTSTEARGSLICWRRGGRCACTTTAFGGSGDATSASGSASGAADGPRGSCARSSNSCDESRLAAGEMIEGNGAVPSTAVLRGFTVTTGAATFDRDEGAAGGARATGAAGCGAESSSHIGLSTDANRSASSAESGADVAGAGGDAARCRPSELPMGLDPSDFPFNPKR